MLIYNPHGVIHAILKAKYCPRAGSWKGKPRNSTNPSAFRRGVQQGEAMFWAGLTFNVERGDSIAFWLDRWCTNIPFASLFSEFFMI